MGERCHFTYRMTPPFVIVMLGFAAVLVWFTSVFVFEDSYRAFVAGRSRHATLLTETPRPVVIAFFGSIALVPLLLLALQARAAAAGKVLAEIDGAGVTHHGL